MQIDLLFLVACISFLVAGCIKGIAGIGLPTVAIGLMTLFLDPRTAIALVMFPMIGSNAWQMLRAGALLRTVRRYAVFAIILFFGVAVTTYYTRETPDRALLAILGAVILLFVVVSWRDMVPPLPQHYDTAAQIFFGLFSGVVGGLTAGWGAPLAMYLATKQTDKDEFVRATGFLIFIGSLPLCYAYARLGFLNGSLATMSALMLIPSLLGFTAGEFFRNRLSLQEFRNAVLIMFLLLGVNLIRRSIWYT